MKKILLSLLVLSGCASTPDYIFTNNHKIDSDLSVSGSCIVIDNTKTQYKRGTRELSANPFYGSEVYPSDDIARQHKQYNNDYKNPSCKYPVTLARHIDVAHITYPDTCYRQEYAGSVVTSKRTVRNYRGQEEVQYERESVYNDVPYSCTKNVYKVSIDFFQNNSSIGQIQTKGWTHNRSLDSIIDDLTDEFVSQTLRQVK